MRCWPTRPTPAGRTTRCCAAGASKRSSPEKADQQHNRLRLGSLGGRPVSYDTEPDKGRNVVERSYESFKQRRGLATGYDKLAVVFRGAATVPNSIVRWLRSP